MAAPTVLTEVVGDELVIKITPDIKTWSFHRGHTAEQLIQELNAVAASFTSRLPQDRPPDQDFLARLRVGILWILLKWESFGAATIPITRQHDHHGS